MRQTIMHKISAVSMVGVISCPALAMTSKDRTMAITGGGCAFGLGYGAYADSQNNSERKNSAAALGVSTATGCVMGLLWSWAFVDDDQSAEVKRADAAERRVDEIMRSVRNSDYRPSGKAQLLDSLKLEENFKGPSAIERMVDPSCEKWKFSLSFDGRGKDDIYIPVSRDVIVKNIEFYIVAPKPGVSVDTVCVKPQEPFDYLNLELPGLDSLLYKHGENIAKRKRGDD